LGAHHGLQEPDTELQLKMRPQGTLVIRYTFTGENFGEVGMSRMTNQEMQKG
jgi:hypothetical protein